MPLCLFLVGPLHISQVELFQRTIPFQGRQRRRRHRHFPKKLAALAFVPDDLLFFQVSVGFDGFWWGISRSAPQNHSREVSFQEVNEDEASNFFAAYFLEGRWNGLLLGTEYLAKLSLKTTPSCFFVLFLLLLCSSHLTSLLIPLWLHGIGKRWRSRLLCFEARTQLFEN